MGCEMPSLLTLAQLTNCLSFVTTVYEIPCQFLEAYSSEELS